MTSTSRNDPSDGEAAAANLRRLMAREGLTFQEVVEASGLDERTIRGLARGANKPQARTLHKLAHGLGVAVDELFQPPAASAARQFDRLTNPEIERAVARHGDLFGHWSAADFDELYSQFGAGGALNESGVLAAAEAINAKRALMQQVAVILESSEAELLTDLVEALYRRAIVDEDFPPAPIRNEPVPLRVHDSLDRGHR